MSFNQIMKVAEEAKKWDLVEQIKKEFSKDYVIAKLVPLVGFIRCGDIGVQLVLSEFDNIIIGIIKHIHIVGINTDMIINMIHNNIDTVFSSWNDDDHVLKSLFDGLKKKYGTSAGPSSSSSSSSKLSLSNLSLSESDVDSAATRATNRFFSDYMIGCLSEADSIDKQTGLVLQEIEMISNGDPKITDAIFAQAAIVFSGLSDVFPDLYKKLQEISHTEQLSGSCDPVVNSSSSLPAVSITPTELRSSSSYSAAPSLTERDEMHIAWRSKRFIKQELPKTDGLSSSPSSSPSVTASASTPPVTTSQTLRSNPFAGSPSSRGVFAYSGGLFGSNDPENPFSLDPRLRPSPPCPSRK